MKSSPIFKIAVLCISIVLIGLLFIQLRAKSTVASFLDRKIPAHINLEYDDLAINILAGEIQFSNINLNIRDRDTTLNHTSIRVNELTFEGLSHWQFFFKNTIKASLVSVTKPQLEYYPSKSFRKETDKPQGLVKLLKNIEIEKIAITNGSFKMWQQKNDSILVSARDINFVLNSGKTNPEIIQQKIPLTYDGYNFSAAEIFVDLGSYESVKADKLSISETNAELTNMVLKSKYSKANLSNIIPKERDHIELKIPKSNLKKIDFGFEENRFFFSSQFGLIENLDLIAYRDKLVEDDFTFKKMYSSMLRELPLNLTIDSLALVNSKIKYAENHKRETKAGSLFFDDVNLKLKNISNTYPKGGQTIATAEGKLMGSALITLNYSFDVSDSQDGFTLAGTVHQLEGEKINSFLKPILNAQIKGEINELYFTTTGNRNAIKGDMKMKYANLKFELLKKDRLKINKLLSAIGNLFINDGSDTDTQGYRYGTIDVERDNTKSFFNYIWIGTQDGIISTLTGDGEKK